MSEAKELHILWTNDDLITSQSMVLMYATKSLLYNCWDAVTVILWGATVKLAADNDIIQEEIKVAQNIGVKFTACETCARQFGAVDKFAGLGIEVAAWVEKLSELVKSGGSLITV